ncbi:putative electron transfer flavoprotein subunit [Mortierella alpina]|nr:putative electron transfer flavoprotein subunit [Mortierella alpina]
MPHDWHHESSEHQSDRDTAMTDVSMGAVSKSTTDPPTATGKKRLASPNSATTSRREPSMASGSSMTPSPRLPPQNAHNPAGSSSPRPRKNSVSSAKKEHKVGVTATSCANCGTTTTPLWRRASNGQTICNACGLYFKARNLTRPPWLKRNMGPKKGETASEEVDELQERNGPSGAGSGVEGQSSSTCSATEKAVENEDKNNDSECAGSCPGDGNCNGAGGAESCAGCPSFNQHQANRQHLVCANCRTTTTPLWRRDSGGNTICNACGLYFKLHNVHRPVTMKRAVIKRRKRVNLLASSPPPESQPGSQPSTQQQQDEQKSQQKEQQQQQARMQMQSKFKSQQSKQATDNNKSAQPTASDLEPSDNDAQAEKQTRAPTKRRKVQGANGTRVPAIEDFILPKRSANGQTEWLPRESGAPEPRRSVSPIENIGNGGHVDGGRERKDYEQHRYGSYSAQDQGSPYSQRSSRSYDPHGPPRDRPSPQAPLEPSQQSHRYHHLEHEQYPSHQAMSMSRYTHLPPPPPRGEPKISAQPSQTAHHAHQHPHAHQQHSSHHHQHSQHHSQDHHPHGITMQGYQGSQSHRAMDVDDNMHPSHYSSSSGWNQRLPGYATVSSSAFSTRLSSTGVVRSSGPNSSSPPLYPRRSPSSPVQTYSHYRSPGPQGSDYHRGESPSLYGSGSSQASTNGSTYHHSFSSILNPIHSGPGDSSDRGVGRKDGPTHLPPISLPPPHHSTSHQQPLPRPSEILHPQQSQQEAGSHHSHHHSYSHQRRPASPPLPISGSSAAAPSALADAPTAIANSAVGAGLRSTEVLQQTREDLQREVSHLSMLLGRAAAVLNGLDQALIPTANGAPTSVAESQHGAAVSALSSDIKTSSALASLMALSTSGERGSGNLTDAPAYSNGSSSGRYEDVHMHSQALPYPPPRHD